MKDGQNNEPIAANSKEYRVWKSSDTNTLHVLKHDRKSLWVLTSGLQRTFYF